MARLMVNFKSMILVKRGKLFLGYLIAEIKKPRAGKVLSIMAFMLKFSDF